MVRTRRNRNMARTVEDIEHLDLENMPDALLRELQSRIREIINRRVQSRLDEFRLMAREAGYEISVSKIGEEPQRRRGRPRAESSGRQDQRRGPLPPLYRNPDNPAEVWSGRGHRPGWLKSRLDAGRKLEEFRIDQQGASQGAEETASAG